MRDAIDPRHVNHPHAGREPANTPKKAAKKPAKKGKKIKSTAA